MVRPRPDLDARFRDGEGSLRQRQIAHIKAHYAEILGDDIELLNLPDGIERLRVKYLARLREVRGAATRLIESRAVRA